MTIIRAITIFGLIAFSSGNIVYKGPTSPAGLNLIKEFECFRPSFYTTPVGVKTIGYGYSCEVHPCDKLKPPITIAQATNLLKTQVLSLENCVNQHVKCAQLNAAQFSALVSFAFDLGCASLKSSSVLNKLNKNDISGAAADFSKFNKIGGKVMPGLTIRRAAERTLFCSNKVC